LGRIAWCPTVLAAVVNSPTNPFVLSQESSPLVNLIARRQGIPEGLVDLANLQNILRDNSFLSTMDVQAVLLRNQQPVRLTDMQQTELALAQRIDERVLQLQATTQGSIHLRSSPAAMPFEVADRFTGILGQHNSLQHQQLFSQRRQQPLLASLVRFEARNVSHLRSSSTAAAQIPNEVLLALLLARSAVPSTLYSGQQQNRPT
jgi:hypothetical protein